MLGVSFQTRIPQNAGWTFIVDRKSILIIILQGLEAFRGFKPYCTFLCSAQRFLLLYLLLHNSDLSELPYALTK
jgi:hypothetical protein